MRRKEREREEYLFSREIIATFVLLCETIHVNDVVKKKQIIVKSRR